MAGVGGTVSSSPLIVLLDTRYLYGMGRFEVLERVLQEQFGAGNVFTCVRACVRACERASQCACASAGTAQRRAGGLPASPQDHRHPQQR